MFGDFLLGLAIVAALAGWVIAIIKVRSWLGIGSMAQSRRFLLSSALIVAGGMFSAVTGSASIAIASVVAAFAVDPNLFIAAPVRPRPLNGRLPPRGSAIVYSGELSPK